MEHTIMYPSLKQSHRRITVRLRNANAELLGHHRNKGVPEGGFRRLADCFPQYLVSKNRIELMLPAGHRDLCAFLDYARSLDLVVENNCAVQSQVEILDYTKWSQAQISDAVYLNGSMFAPVLDSCLKIEGGKVAATFSNLEAVRDYSFGSLTNFPNLVFVRQSLKSKLYDARLKGLSCILVQTDRSDGAWVNETEPLYLLWSTILFPATDLSVFNSSGSVKKSSECDWNDNSTTWYPVDGYEVSPPLKYGLPVPETDVGLSLERFGGVQEIYRRVIYSQRARSILEDLGLQLDWMPVRLGKEAPGCAF